MGSSIISKLIMFVVLFAISYFVTKHAKKTQAQNQKVESHLVSNSEETIIIKGKFNYSVIFVLIFLTMGLLFLPSLLKNAVSKSVYDTIVMYGLILFFVLAIAILVFCFNAMKTNLTITNKRIVGTASHGRRVDLPVDSVSSIGASSFSGITIASPSGRISFLFLGNRDEVYQVVSELLANRKTMPVPIIYQEKDTSNADELRKYKKLLDDGVISQEEFDAKKKQLLGL